MPSPGSPAAIWTAPGTDVSAIFGLHGKPQTDRTDFDGHQAWFSGYRAADNDLTWASAEETPTTSSHAMPPSNNWSPLPELGNQPPI